MSRLPLLLALMACTPPSTTDTSRTPGTTTSSTTVPVYDGVVEGVLVYPDGSPMAGVGVTLCGGICQVADAGPDGSFRFEGVWPQNNVLETLNYPGEDQTEAVLGWSRYFDLVPVSEGDHIVLEQPLVVHPVVTQQGLTGPQDLTLAPGLQVAFDADRIGEERPLPAPAEVLAIGATELPEADWPKAVGDWTPLAAWTFAIWDLEIEDGFAVTATLNEPLPAEAEVAFLVADYLHGFVEGTLLEEPAILSPDGLTVSSPPNAGLDRTTLWVLATRP